MRGRPGVAPFRSPLKEEFTETIDSLAFEGLMDFVFDDCRTQPIFPEEYLDEEGGEDE